MRSLFIIIPVFLWLSGQAFAQGQQAQAQVNPVPSSATIPAPIIPQATTSPVEPNTDAIARAEKLTQQIRAEERIMDQASTSLTWMPWSQTGKQTQEFVIKRDKNIKSLLGSGNRIDVAAFDFDHNNQPDIILYFWGDCGIQGCLYKIYYDSLTKNPSDHLGYELVPYKEGIMLDHGYFRL